MDNRREILAILIMISVSIMLLQQQYIEPHPLIMGVAQDQ